MLFFSLIAGLALAAGSAVLLAGRESGRRPVQVKIEDGILEGVAVDGVASFKGIPFAAPPVGPFRWRAPQPVEPWGDVRPATSFGPKPVQPPEAKASDVGYERPSEDCLYLNVYRPETLPESKPLPVMVWIYGGGFWAGSASSPITDGSPFARSGLVFVSFNYRVGRLGFFAHPALTQAAGNEPVANYGLMDQIAALQWVRANIHAFGGDPSCVTIFGESAGAMSVDSLMTSPLARGLFHRAISQSAPGRFVPQPLAAAERSGMEVAERFGAESSDVLAKLRAIPADQLSYPPQFSMFGGEAPILDGKLIVEPAEQAFSEGRQAAVPYMVGSTELEIPARYLPPDTAARERVSEASRAQLLAAYGSQSEMDLHFWSDVVFTEPAWHRARLQAKLAPVYRYRFSVLSIIGRLVLSGAPHAIDVVYIFRNRRRPPWLITKREFGLAVEMHAYWAAFARTGSPNGPGRPEWPLSATHEILNFTNRGALVEADPRQDRLRLLEALYESGYPPMIWGPMSGNPA